MYGWARLHIFGHSQSEQRMVVLDSFDDVAADEKVTEMVLSGQALAVCFHLKKPPARKKEQKTQHPSAPGASLVQLLFLALGFVFAYIQYQNEARVPGLSSLLTQTARPNAFGSGQQGHDVRSLISVVIADRKVESQINNTL